MTGRAGEELVWEFGDGERFVTVGDQEVRRVVEVELSPRDLVGWR